MRRPLVASLALLLGSSLALACATTSGLSGPQVAGVISGVGTVLVASVGVFTCVQYEQCYTLQYVADTYDPDYASADADADAPVSREGSSGPPHAASSVTIPLPASPRVREARPVPTLELGPTGLRLRF